MASEEDSIAIVGIGCRFPGAENIDEFWKVLKNGENHVKEIPKDRWNVDAFYDPDPTVPGKTYAKTAGLVQGIDEWDHRLYGINDMEAELIDPQQRLVLDCVHMALEDAGITKKHLSGTNTAVYIGSMTDDYKSHVLSGNETGSAYSVTGTHNSIISARVSYIYNLTGTSITLDTACSSSLVAIDTASQAILSGRCSTAICGGVNVILDATLFVALSKAGMLSRTGQCKTFSVEADGYSRGEGCGVVILKSLKDALKDGNKIWGTIKTGTNQDGRGATPITAPAGKQQEYLIEDVYTKYGIKKSQISVIEAHGTGTPIGDPTEVEALGAHFGRAADENSSVFIGSVKTNIGHLEAAAGIAGLIKVLLMMKYETIVPSLWYQIERENPKLKLDSKGFVVPTECIDWLVDSNDRRIACVNSFGFGGTNAHAVVEQYFADFSDKPVKRESKLGPLHNEEYIVCISAADFIALSKSMKDMMARLEQDHVNLEALSYTSTCRRDHRTYRKAIRGRSKEEIISSCNNFLGTADWSQYHLGLSTVAFVFCGVGTAWIGMCCSLMEVAPFREAIYDIDRYLQPLTSLTISDKFIDSYDILKDPCMSHIAIFACQVGLVAIWKYIGIQPSLVIGQSIGEIAAAYTAGYIDLQEAVRIVYYRSTYLARCRNGGMTVIRNLSINDVEENCTAIDSVSIAVYNSLTSCTVSGDLDAIQQLKETLIDKYGESFDMIDLNVSCAYHTEYVGQAAVDLEQSIETVKGQDANVQFISTVTGKTENAEVILSAEYWANNVRKPVLYSEAVVVAGNSSDRVVFVEVGPNPTLHAHFNDILTGSNNHVIFPSMRRNRDLLTFKDTLLALYDVGVDIDWKAIIPYHEEITNIPRCLMNKQKLLYESHSSVMAAQGLDNSTSKHMCVTQVPSKEGKVLFKLEINATLTPFVYEHEVNNQIIVPGAMFADMAFEIAEVVLGEKVQNCNIAVEFLRPAKVDKNISTQMYVSTFKQQDGVLIHAKLKNTTMCKGFVKHTQKPNVRWEKINLNLLTLRITNSNCVRKGAQEMYEILQKLGFKHGPSYQLMTKCVTNGKESITEIRVPVDIFQEADRFNIHPCILDAMMQSTINVTDEQLFDLTKEETLTFLPVALGELTVLQKPEEKMYVHTTRINTTILDTVFQIHYNACLFNEEGTVIADLQNYTTYSNRQRSKAPCELRHQLEWQPRDIKSILDNVKTEPNILVFSNQQFNIFGNNCPIVYQKYQYSSFIEDIKDAFVSSNEAFGSVSNINVIVLVIPEKRLYHTDTDNIKEISMVVADNCLLIQHFLKCLLDMDLDCRTYIVTQNTQNKPSNISLLGRELWGFIRSLQMEAQPFEITMVDVQPSIHEASNDLLEFVLSTYNHVEDIDQEVIIKNGTVFGAQISKSARHKIIPDLRREHSLQQRDETNHAVFKTNPRNTDDPYFLPAGLSDPPSSCIFNKFSHVQVKSVYMHSNELFPNTSEDAHGDIGVKDISRETRFHLYGLEFIGTSVNANNRTEDIGTDHICIFPFEVNTNVFVPKGCMIKLSKLGENYSPGMLLHAMIFWRLAEYVKKGSQVSVCWNNHPYERNMLKHILQYRRVAQLVDANLNTPDIENNKRLLITFDEFDPCSSNVFHFSDVVCPANKIPESVRQGLTKYGKVKVQTFTVDSLLDCKSVAKHLPKVSKWLKQFLASSIQEIPQCFDHNRSMTLIDRNRLLLPVRKTMDHLFSKSKSYVVTGGLTGLGWEISKLLADMGAGYIFFITRRKPTLEQFQDMTDVEKATDCKIDHIAADVTDITSLQSAFQLISSKSNGSKISGIFHCAGVLVAEQVMDITKDTLHSVFDPKVSGIMNLHCVTKDMDIEYFVASSSFNSLIGSIGQASYGAANAFMDAFIEWRRNNGFAGQSINWGAMSFGMGGQKEFSKPLADSGSNLLSVLEVRSCLKEAMMHNSTNCLYTNTNWELLTKDFSKRQRLIVNVLLDEESVAPVTDLSSMNVMFDLDVLKVADRSTRLQAINKVVRFVADKVIDGDMNLVKGSSTLSELGFDSMSSVTFVNIVRDITGYRIAAYVMADKTKTLDDVVQVMYDGIFGQ